MAIVRHPFRTTLPIALTAGLIASVATLTQCAPAHSPTSSGVQPAARAELVVAIVVDQLAAWEMHDRLPILPASGGFRRLAREGVYLEKMLYEHAATDTAPGHAALFTGLWPSETGVVQNEVIDAKGNVLSLLRDENVRLVSSEGKIDAVGSSSSVVKAKTVADHLREREPSARIVGLSLKDRGALIPTGHACNVCVWFDAGQDRFVSSTAIADTLPEWASVGSHEAVLKKRESPWVPLDEKWLEEHALTKDSQEGEGDLAGLGTTFPHRALNGKAFRATPMSDEVLFDLAIRAIDNEHPRLLTLSLSAHDMISHAFGPDSREAFDEILRLDRSLAIFLAELDKRFPKGNYGVVLSADHGSVPMPEARSALRSARPCGENDAYKRPCDTGVRIDASALTEELKKEISAAVGEGDWLRGVADPFVVLSDHAHRAPLPTRDAIDHAVSRVVARHPEFDRVFGATTLTKECPSAADSLLRLVCHSYIAAAGDYFIVPKAGSFFDPYIVKGFGTSHGTPWMFDRTVPLFARGPFIEKGTFVAEPRSFRIFSSVITGWLENSGAPIKSAMSAPPP